MPCSVCAVFCIHTSVNSSLLFGRSSWGAEHCNQSLKISSPPTHFCAQDEAQHDRTLGWHRTSFAFWVSGAEASCASKAAFTAAFWVSEREDDGTRQLSETESSDGQVTPVPASPSSPPWHEQVTLSLPPSPTPCSSTQVCTSPGEPPPEPWGNLLPSGFRRGPLPRESLPSSLAAVPRPQRAPGSFLAWFYQEITGDFCHTTKS